MERERRRSSTGASSAADGGSDPPDIFAAALQGDLAQVRALIARRDDRMEAGGYTALGLAVSAGHTEIARLLLREGVTVDAADAEGVTALMHAAMHGYGSLVDLLLLHGASPLTTRADGESAHTLAALYGRPAALGAFFRHDATLVEARNGLGRTPLHNAVTLRHLITIKYLLGAWRADVNATDAQGNTPLHLCRGPLEALTLLFHGTATRPSLTARNAAGRTPLEEISFSSPSNVVIQALQDAEGRDDAAEWLAGPGIDAKLLSFLTDSPVRSPPKTCPDPPWWSQLTPAVVLGSLAPYVLGLTLAFSVTAGAAMLFLTPVAAAWWGMCLAHAGCRRHLQSLLSPCPGLSFLLGVTERPEALRHALDIRAPLGLVLAILFLMATQAVLVTPQLIRQRPLLCLASYTFQALLIYAYTRAVLTRPSLIPGGGADAAAGYWAALEALPPNAGFPSDFCERSELRKEPRARYSPMAGGMIEVMDHDCIWIGSVVGQSNHPSFLAFLLAALPAMSLHLVALATLHPDPLWYIRNFTRETDHTPEARLLAASILICVLLLLMVVPLLIFHIWGAAFNVTTMESMRFRWEKPNTMPPWCCAHPRAWRAYSPYDRGVIANLVAFCAGTRSAMPAVRWPEDPLSPAGDLEVGAAGEAPSVFTAHEHEHRHCHGSHSHEVHRELLGSARDAYSDAD